MNQNLLGLDILSPRPLFLIANKICEILTKLSKENVPIEIEFKYAQFTAFCNSFYYKQRNITNDIRPIVEYYVMQQSGLHFQTLKNLSHSNFILLNQFGPRVYRLDSAFDEKKHKKFYKMRQFLINLCNFNMYGGSNTLNFYKQIQAFANNKTFQIISQSEMRMDINVKYGQLSGRYSYTLGLGWTCTKKQDLSTQYDIMLAERTFRLGIKKEQTNQVISSQVFDALQSVQNKTGAVHLRFKRALRVSKNNQIQIALSEIYQPPIERDLIGDIKDMIEIGDNLDQFVIRTFQQFYMQQPDQKLNNNFKDAPTKYQIQSEFLPAGFQKIKQFVNSGRRGDLQRYIENALADLYALYFVDHNVKKRETKILSEIIKSKNGNVDKFSECRIQNQFGSYMHNVIHQFMDNN